MRPLGLVAAAVLLLAGAAGGAGSPPQALTLAADGRPQAVIVLPGAPSSSAKEAARILADHLREITGAEFKTVSEEKLPGATVRDGRIVISPDADGTQAFILVGEGRLARDLRATSDGLGPGGILIRTTGNAPALLGPDEKTPSDTAGTRHAVTVFLEDYLGVRYLWPGQSGKVVPKQPTIGLPAIDVRKTPVLGLRWKRLDERLQTGLDRLGYTGPEYEQRRREAEAVRSDSGTWLGWHRLGGTLGFVSGHAFGHMWEKYSKDHPEWFALQKNGSRDLSHLTPQRARLCKSNIALLEQIACDKIEELRAREARGLSRAVSLSPNDGGRATFCTCQECRKLDPPGGRKVELHDDSTGSRKMYEYVSLTDRMVWFWNAIAERVCKVYPDAVLTADGYSVYRAPPIERALHPNIVIRVVVITYASDSTRRAGLEDWDGWAAKVQRVYWRPNLLHAGAKEGTLMVYVHKLAEDFRRLARNRMMGTDFDSCIQHWATHGLNYYVLAKLHWDPDTDVDAVIDDYCRSGFGPAAPEVKRYFAKVEALTNQCAAGETGVTEPYTPEAVAELGGLLDAADRKAAADEAVRGRLAFLRTGLDFTDIQARIYRRLAEAGAGKAVDKAAAGRLLDEKFAMMRGIFAGRHLAVNVGHVCWGEWGRFKALGWKGPGPDAASRTEADEEGRPAEVPAPGDARVGPAGGRPR